MSLLIAMITGIIVGAVGGFILMEGIDFLLLNMAMGLVGGLLGLATYSLLLIGDNDTALFEWRAILTSALFALIFVFLFNILHKFFPRRASLVNGDQGEADDIEK